MNETTLRIRDLLKGSGNRLVLVESCTSGWVASQFGMIPGISECFCGSLVVYRNNSKNQWLEIDQAILDDPQIGPVSNRVTTELAVSVLRKTPEATIAAAITGHLGPGAPSGQDGNIFISIARRTISSIESVTTIPGQLKAPCPQHDLDFEARFIRQQEAGNLLLTVLEGVSTSK
ncbi:MAG: CinA family protein [Planctomycetota bacterium]|nr:CinA family protein [Planctomycetota bacterium]